MYKRKSWLYIFKYAILKLMPACGFIILFSALLLITSTELRHEINSDGAGVLKFAVVAYSDTPISERNLQGIKAGLKENNYSEGRDYIMREYNAQGDIGTLNGIVDVLAGENFDLIFTISTPVLQAVLKKIKRTPIVFSSTGDPIGAGAGKNFNDHVMNATGICSISDFNGMIDLVRKISPGVKKIGTVFCPGEINSVLYKNHLKNAAAAYGILCEEAAASCVAEVTDAANFLCSGRGVEIICQIADNLSASSFTVILKAANTAGIPVFGFIESDAKKGAVLSYSKDYYSGGVDAARLAVKIIKGGKIVSIPFEYISKTTLAINKKAAMAKGIKIPEAIMRAADEIIE